MKWCIVDLGIWNGLSPCLGQYKKGNGVAVYLHLTTYQDRGRHALDWIPPSPPVCPVDPIVGTP